jgi:hypothetical protein
MIIWIWILIDLIKIMLLQAYQTGIYLDIRIFRNYDFDMQYNFSVCLYIYEYVYTCIWSDQNDALASLSDRYIFIYMYIYIYVYALQIL